SRRSSNIRSIKNIDRSNCCIAKKTGFVRCVGKSDYPDGRYSAEENGLCFLWRRGDVSIFIVGKSNQICCVMRTRIGPNPSVRSEERRVGKEWRCRRWEDE